MRCAAMRCVVLRCAAVRCAVLEMCCAAMRYAVLRCNVLLCAVLCCLGTSVFCLGTCTYAAADTLIKKGDVYAGGGWGCMEGVRELGGAPRTRAARRPRPRTPAHALCTPAHALRTARAHRCARPCTFSHAVHTSVHTSVHGRFGSTSAPVWISRVTSMCYGWTMDN